VHDYSGSLETIPGGPVITNYYTGPPGLTFLYFIGHKIITVPTAGERFSSHPLASRLNRISLS
jgi:hypothetical protein